MRKLVFITLSISLLTIVGFWGGKKACMMFMWPGSVHPSNAWYLELGLSPGQEKELKALDSSFRKETDAMCMRICRERLELLSALQRPQSDAQAIHKKIDAIGAMQIALEKEIATHILRVKANLTPEQSENYLSRIRDDLQQTIKKNGLGEWKQSQES